MQGTSDNSAFVARSLRENDFSRYAASLVIARDKRAAVQSIWAFAAEVATVRERVSEPAPGEIRLQWWADALQGREHGAVSQNPLAQVLLETLDSHALPAGPLLRLLAARRFDLYSDPMPDMGQFEGYAGETVSVLYQYAAMILNGDSAEVAADAAGHLGVAQALAGHIRAFGYNAAREQIFLPMSVFAAHGVRERDILSGTPGEKLDAALAQLREIATEHVEKAEKYISTLPGSVKPAFSSVVLVRPMLKAEARRTGAAVFTAPPRTAGFMTLARTTLWALRHGS